MNSRTVDDAILGDSIIRLCIDSKTDSSAAREVVIRLGMQTSILKAEVPT